MPPWPAQEPVQAFLGERRLSNTQIRWIAEWANSSAPEGRATPLPSPPQFPENWQLGVPDLILTLPEPFDLHAAGEDVWRTFVIPTGLFKNQFIRAVEFKPNHPSVHHALMAFDNTSQSRIRDAGDPGLGFGGFTLPASALPPGGHVLTWLPGRGPYVSPPWLTWPINKIADFVLQLHMQPTGKLESVRPQVGFYYTDEGPTNSPFVFPLRVRTIDIPAGERAYRVMDEYALPVDIQLLWLNPHAHFLGKKLEATALLPDGSRRLLLRIDDWNMNWQVDYRFRQPVDLPRGTILRMEFTYDNSDSNPRNPQRPARRVRYGQSSTDEMAELWIQVLPRDANARAELERDYQRKSLREQLEYELYERIFREPQ